jgi:hypothetical protein
MNESDVDDQLQLEADDLPLDRNQTYLRNLKWKLDPRNFGGIQVQYVKKPTASHINYRCMHPNLYRNLNKIADVNQLAQLLGAPADWEAIQ